jgi:hypothetical protein
LNIMRSWTVSWYGFGRNSHDNFEVTIRVLPVQKDDRVKITANPAEIRNSYFCITFFSTACTITTLA